MPQAVAAVGYSAFQQLRWRDNNMSTHKSPLSPSFNVLSRDLWIETITIRGFASVGRPARQCRSAVSFLPNRILPVFNCFCKWW